NGVVWIANGIGGGTATYVGGEVGLSDDRSRSLEIRQCVATRVDRSRGYEEKQKQAGPERDASYHAVLPFDFAIQVHENNLADYEVAPATAQVLAPNFKTRTECRPNRLLQIHLTLPRAAVLSKASDNRQGR